MVHIVCMCILYITKPHAHTLYLCATHILYYTTYVPTLLYYTSPLQVYPQEIQAKRNFQSQKSTGFDSQQNTVSVGDVVNVISGMYIRVYVYAYLVRYRYI